MSTVWQIESAVHVHISALCEIPFANRPLQSTEEILRAIAAHSSILAWKSPWTEELGGLQSVGRAESDTTKCVRAHTQQCLYINPSLPIYPSQPLPLATMFVFYICDSIYVL